MTTTNAPDLHVHHYKLLSLNMNNYVNSWAVLRQIYFQHQQRDRQSKCEGSIFFVCLSLIQAANYCSHECCCVLPTTTIHWSSSCRGTDGWGLEKMANRTKQPSYHHTSALTHTPKHIRLHAQPEITAELLENETTDGHLNDHLSGGCLYLCIKSHFRSLRGWINRYKWRKQ